MREARASEPYGLQPDPATEEPEAPPVAVARPQRLDALPLIHERLVVLTAGVDAAALPVGVDEQILDVGDGGAVADDPHEADEPSPPARPCARSLSEK